MISKCTVCRLEQKKRQAIEDALKAGVPLDALAERSAISKSTLSRHNQHLVRGEESQPQPVIAPAAVIPPEPKSATPPAPVAIVKHPDAVIVDIEPAVPAHQLTASAAANKAQLLERIELLWDEALDGLEASKQPIVVKKPDGSALEIPGDLRARGGFIREARQVLELRGAADGSLTRDPGPPAGVQILIAMPGRTPAAALGDEWPGGVTIDLPATHK